jgi:hypothetical protein
VKIIKKSVANLRSRGDFGKFLNRGLLPGVFECVLFTLSLRLCRRVMLSVRLAGLLIKAEFGDLRQALSCYVRFKHLVKPMDSIDFY